MEQFGKYSLIRKVGTGGMAEVFLARTTVAQGLNKTLVIKKIHTAYAKSRQFVTMFVDEAKIALGLNHPNIIQVFDFGAVGDTYFLAMEYVEGMDLLRLLQEAAKARQRLPYGISAYIVQQLAKGLDYAHRKTDEFGEPLGIVHRDISPQNVLLSFDGGVKIVDFGIARARDVHEEQGVIKGKFAYMSPEQARGEPVDCRSDVFAAGIVLFELTCARPLFNGKGKEALEMVKSGAIPRPREFAPELPDSLERIILKALAFHRDDRYQTARDLQHDLSRFQFEWAQKAGSITDSGALAVTLSQLAPQEQRPLVPRPPNEGGAGGGGGGGGGPRSGDGGSAASGPIRAGALAAVAAAASDLSMSAIPQPVLAEPSAAISRPIARAPSPGSVVGEVAKPHRERKYVYVLQGILRGMTALERRLGVAGAAKLVNEFLKVARDVAFKHDALVERDGREARDEIGGSAPTPVPTGAGGEPSGPHLGGAAGRGQAASGETTLRVVIGLPVAGEDDAGRAIHLALALVDALDGIGSDVEPELRLALAVQRGVALVRRGESTAQGGFEIEETTAAFAHKLARQARGAEILVGGRVFRAARAEWNFEALAAIDLPEVLDAGPGTQSTKGGGDSTASPTGTGAAGGRTAPPDEDTDPGVKRARVYRLRGPKERSQRLRERRLGSGMTSVEGGSRLHGRELELKALRDAWRDVLVTRRKRQIMIVGDPGVGKRTVVRTFLDGISPSEAVVIRTSGRVGTAMTPYGVIADLARDVLGLAENAEPHEVEKRLLRAAPLIFPGEEGSREARLAIQIFGMLLGARPAATDEAVDPETRRQTLILLLNRIEQRLEGDKPIILVGEDIHWTDQDSQELFAALLKVETPRPILGLMTSRHEPRILKLAKELGTEVVYLDELPELARRQLLAERFVPGHDIDELLEQVTARAGGNAFFIQELLDTLIERGVLVADGESGEYPGLLRWLKREARIDVPSTIEDLILTRIDALPTAERDVLVHAAVLGRHVAASALTTLLDRPVRTELDELVRRGLLSALAPASDPTAAEYRFKNDMTMTVAYGLLAQERRTYLHRAVASRIASAVGYRHGQDDALIARHLELAGDDAAAADRYQSAADHAVELGGNADAFRQLSRALKLLPEADHERRFAAHRVREEILRRLAKRPQQLRELHALRRESDALAQPGKQAFAHAALAQFYIDVGKAPAALRAVAPALQFAREAKDVLLEAEALRLKSAIARLVGNGDESLALAEEALALVDRAAGQAGNEVRPPTPVLMTRATILNQRGTTLWNMGRLEAAIESYAEALVIYRAIGMARNEARALNNMGIVFAALGEYEEALAHYKSALKIDQALGDRSGIAQKLGNIGQCYSDLGDVERAESYLGKAMKIAEQTGDLSAAADTAVSLGQTQMQRGEPKRALAMFERGLAIATENRERYQEVRALQYIALAHLASGDPPEDALEIARSATDWARKMPMLVGIIWGLTFQALALSKLGRHAEAVAAIDEAVGHLEGARPEGAENIHRWRADILTAAGQPAAAAAAAARAAAETAAKASRLRDPVLREHFLASRARAV